MRIVDTLGVGTTGPVDNGKANRGSTTAEIWTNQSSAIREVGGLPILAHVAHNAATLLLWKRSRKGVTERDPHEPEGS